jgi:hypothetical protein
MLDEMPLYPKLSNQCEYTVNLLQLKAALLVENPNATQETHPRRGSVVVPASDLCQRVELYLPSSIFNSAGKVTKARAPRLGRFSGNREPNAVGRRHWL